MTNVAVIYYSATGNIAAMAHALGEGARETGAEVRIHRVAENAPAEAIDANPRWRAFLDMNQDDPATLDDLAWADAIALGSPTRFGAAAAQLKSFLDTTGGLWATGVLAGKVCTAFTSSSTAHGGLESTILAINNHFYHWGSLVMPLGYHDPHVMKRSGNPYGASFVSRSGAAPDDEALMAAQIQGRQLAIVASELSRGRDQGGS
ncbi:MAG: NAD(P)H:quinone oxidoreductase [Actinobacteria bacterium]|nr:NAD(P)H:quinone oxidoreductase [Actinomycetota bacterium]